MFSGHSPGHWLQLKDIQNEINNDPELDPLYMSKQCKQELIDKLAQHRILKSQGSCSSNQASALNAHQNIKAIMMEVGLHVMHTNYLPTDMWCRWKTCFFIQVCVFLHFSLAAMPKIPPWHLLQLLTTPSWNSSLRSSSWIIQRCWPSSSCMLALKIRVSPIISVNEDPLMTLAGVTMPDTLPLMHVDCTGLILDGLHEFK